MSIRFSNISLESASDAILLLAPGHPMCLGEVKMVLPVQNFLEDNSGEDVSVTVTYYLYGDKGLE